VRPQKAIKVRSVTTLPEKRVAFRKLYTGIEAIAPQAALFTKHGK